MDKKILKKRGIYALLTTGAILTGCSGISTITGNRMTISINEEDEKASDDVDKNEETEKKSDTSSWTTYEVESNLYKVNLDKMFSNYFDVFKNDNPKFSEYIKRMKKEITSFLGHDIYLNKIKENSISASHSVKLFNLEGKELSVSDGFDGEHLHVRYSPEENIYINLNASDYNYSYDYNQGDEYDVPLRKLYFMEEDDKEVFRGLVFRHDGQEDFGFTLWTNKKLDISSEYGEASFKLNDKEYNTIKNVMDEYGYEKNSDLTSFLTEHSDLVNNYLNEIKSENEDFYNNLVANINQLTSKNNILAKKR